MAVSKMQEELRLPKKVSRIRVVWGSLVQRQVRRLEGQAGRKGQHGEKQGHHSLCEMEK